MAARRKASKAQPKAGSPEAKEQELFEALAGLLRRLGHDVHVSKTLDGRGGDCLVNGEKRVIVSRRMPMAERVDVLVEVARRQDLEGVELTPELAEVLAPGGAGEP